MRSTPTGNGRYGGIENAILADRLRGAHGERKLWAAPDSGGGQGRPGRPVTLPPGFVYEGGAWGITSGGQRRTLRSP
jgi:hypothetical protein